MDEPSLVGAEIARYQIERELGRGGMGVVYIGVLPSIGSRVAIKVLSAKHVGDRELAERFFAEARAVNLIRHENIVAISDLGHLPDGRPYIVMELVDGQTLGHIIRHSRPSLAAIANLMIEVLSALAAAHAIGIVHRDLKPDNILVTAMGHAKVLDFGIAKLVGARHLGLTHTGALLGTPAYMAPEQLADASAVDGRADLYAAGVVLYEAIAGRLPFTGSAYELMRAHAEDPPPPFALIRRDVPPALEQIVGIALEKQPARRFATADAMAAALEAAIRALPDSQDRLELLPAPATASPSTRGAASIVAPSVVAPSVVAPSVVAPSVVAPSFAAQTPIPMAPSPAMPLPAATPMLPPAATPMPLHTTPMPPPATTPMQPMQTPTPLATPVVAGKPTPWRWIALGGTVVIAIAIVIGLVVRSSSNEPLASTQPSKAEPTKLPPTTPQPTKRTPDPPPDLPVTVPGPAPTLKFDANAFDPRRFDVIAFAKLADAAAHTWAADATLSTIQLNPVAGDGSIDLARRKPNGFAAKLVFRSAAKRACLVIAPQPDHSVTTEVVSSCPEKPVRLPRCPLAHLIAQASAGNAGSVSVTVTATYHQTRDGPVWTFAWSLDNDDVDDEC